jgi:hypothetical protein
VARGSGGRLGQAALLIRKYPQDAPLVLARALATSSYDTASRLVSILGADDLDGPARNAAERILISALEDTYADPNLPRVCDLAARTLAHGWEGKYTFDPSASLELRDRQIAAIKEIWRKGGGPGASV